MTKPTPEQFDLTAETVASLTQERDKRTKRREVVCWKVIFVLWLVAAVYVLVTSFPSAHSVSDAFGFLFLVVFVGAPMSLAFIFFIGMPVTLIGDHLLLWMYPDPPSYTQLKRYQEAVKEYEAWFIRTQQAFWNRLTGREFEIEVANLLNRVGYHASLTPASGDEGVDIVLGDGTIVQCKAHRAPASPGVVRELYGALIHQKAPKALLISRSGWTKGVHSFIQGKPITVWDMANLISLQKGLDK